MLRDMDLARIVLGVAFALSGAFGLISSLGKPPEWTPASYQRFNAPRFLWGRDRVRVYALAVLLFGLGLVLYFGVVTR